MPGRLARLIWMEWFSLLQDCLILTENLSKFQQLILTPLSLDQDKLKAIVRLTWTDSQLELIPTFCPFLLLCTAIIHSYLLSPPQRGLRILSPRIRRSPRKHEPL